MVGVGVFGGTEIRNAAGGALSADATLLAPARGAFSIWSVIYAGLLAYAVWQFLPSVRSDPRQRRLGWLVGASMLLNAAWILTVQAGSLGLSVLVIAVLLAVLAVLFQRYTGQRPSGLAEPVVVDFTLGLYLGWVCVATAANVASALVAAGFDGFGVSPETWAATVLVAVALIGIGLAAAGAGRLAPAAAITWGLAWIAVSRSAGELLSPATAVAALAAAGIVAAATVFCRIRSGRRRSPAGFPAPGS